MDALENGIMKIQEQISSSRSYEEVLAFLDAGSSSMVEES